MTTHLRTAEGLEELIAWSNTPAHVSRKEGFLTIRVPRPRSKGELFYQRSLWRSIFQSIYEGLIPQRAASVSFLAEVPRTSFALSSIARKTEMFSVAQKISRPLLWRTAEVCFKDANFWWGSLSRLRSENLVTFALGPKEIGRLATLGMKYESVVRGGTTACRLSVPTDAFLEIVIDEWALT